MQETKKKEGEKINFPGQNPLEMFPGIFTGIILGIAVGIGLFRVLESDPLGGALMSLALAGLLLSNNSSLLGWKRSNDGWGKSAFHAFDYALRLHKAEGRLAELRQVCDQRTICAEGCPTCDAIWKAIREVLDRPQEPPTQSNLGRENGPQGATLGHGEDPYRP